MALFNVFELVKGAFVKMTVVVSANTDWYIWNFRRNLIDLLLSEGHRVVVVCPPGKLAERMVGEGYDVRLWRMNPGGLNPLFEMVSFFKLFLILISIRPNVVLSFTPKVNIYAGFLSLVYKFRFVPNVSGLGRSFVHPGFISKFFLFLYSIAFRRADRVFFQNMEDLHYFVSNKVVRADTSIRLPGSGVDLKRFVYKPTRPEATEGNKCFLFASRLIREKGIDEFMSAAEVLKAEYPSSRFLVAGFWDEKKSDNRIKAKVQSLVDGGIIEYLGAVEDVAPLIEACDYVVLPSMYKEGVPRILLEAGACGRPVITTNMPGCRDAVAPELSMFICEVGAQSELTESMRRAIKCSYSELSQMGIMCREHVASEFDEQVVLACYKRLFN